MGYTTTARNLLRKMLSGTPGSSVKTDFDADMEILDKAYLYDADIVPATDNDKSIGSAIKRFLNGYFVNLTLGGVSRNSWPTAVAGSNGNVFQAGAITLNGQTGVTVTHNKGDTSYLVKVLPTGTTAIGKVGDIAYIKSANTVAIYNSGQANLTADIELSAIA